MSRTLVQNVGDSEFGFPAPYSGVLAPGAGAVLDGTPDAVIINLGGLESVGAFLKFTQADNSPLSPQNTNPASLIPAGTLTGAQINWADFQVYASATGANASTASRVVACSGASIGDRVQAVYDFGTASGTVGLVSSNFAGTIATANQILQSSGNLASDHLSITLLKQS